jgi:DUF4097 and DUF4098 domain-containing protein YvlB
VASGAVSVGCGLHFSSGVEGKEEWTRRFPLTAGGSLEIHNTNGKIEVRPGTGAEIVVVATRVARDSDEAAAKQAAARIEIKETVTPDRVRLDSTLGGMEFRQMRRVDYVVTLPDRASLVVHATNGDVDLEGLSGSVTVQSSNARIRGRLLTGPAKLETTNGQIQLDFAKVGGAVQCDTTNGVIEVTIPRDARADLSARVTNGAISHSNLDLTVKEQSRRRLDASLGGGGPEIRLETTNGAIEIQGR